MNFLIQSKVFDTSQKTVKHLENEGHNVTEFSTQFSINESHFFRGSLEMAKEHYDNDNVLMYFDPKSYNFSSFAPKFPYGFLNEDYKIYSFENFQSSKKEIFGKFGKEDFITESGEQIIFVRPDSGLKSFSGQVIDKTFWNAYVNMFRKRNVDDIVVSSPKKVGNEFRFVVFHNGFIKTGSSYIKDDKISYEEVFSTHPAYRSAKRVAEDSSVKTENGCYILDMAETPTEYKVVEINAFSTSDLYNCDRRRIFKSLKPQLDAGRI